jgi:membrane associated rhomboid family serine protease
MVAPAPTPRRSIARVLPTPLRPAAATMLVFTALLYLIETVDTVTGGLLERAGSIVPRATYGLDGILFAPVLHGTWAHLLGNTLPFLIFGFLAMAGGIRQFVLVTATIWILGGVGVWLVGGPGEYLVGASGVIFGWLTFLLTRGFFARSARQILLAIVLFAGWGGVLLGVLPGQPGISWQGHLFGALAGVLAAWMVARADKRSASVVSGP